MKQLTLFFCLFAVLKLAAQVPQSFNYQAIVRDADQKPLAQKDIDYSARIFSGGQPVYDESGSKTTGQTGLFTLQIGEAKPAQFQAIDWSAGDFELEVTVSGPANFTSRSPILSVPFALFAEKAGDLSIGNPQNGQVLKWNGSTWIPQNDLTGSDDWGNQSAKTDVSLSGDGTLANPLKLAGQGATGGQVLKWNSTASKWEPANDIGGGTGDNWGSQTAVVGGGLSGNGTSGSPIVNTGDTNASDDLTNSSVAVGDVTGLFSNLKVERIQNRPVLPTVPTNGQVLKFDGTNWKPDTDNGGTGGDNWGSQAVVIGTGLSGNGTSGSPIVNTGDTNASDDLTNVSTAGGDASGVFSNLKVEKIQNRPVLSIIPTNGQVLKFDGTSWKPDADNGDQWGTQKIEHGVELAGDGTLASKLELAQQGAANNDVLSWDNSSATWKPKPVAVGWGLTGNAGTNSATNFIGTMDDQPIVFKVNGQERLRLETDGRLTVKSKTGTNLFVGDEAGKANTTGYYNTANGFNALALNTTGFCNTATGIRTLSSNTNGVHNTATGTDALKSNTIGSDNTANGAYSLSSNTIGNSNTANGTTALNKNTIGYSNTAFGAYALSFNSTGIRNTAAGANALALNTTGNSNVAVGENALSSNISSSNLVAVGDSALFSNSGGSFNTAIGSKTLFQNIAGYENTATGDRALYSNTFGQFNTATGSDALFSNTTGYENTAVGAGAIRQNLTGNFNTAVGVDALYSNETGNENTATGKGTLYLNESGSWNSAYGSGALYSNTTGGYNTASGFAALWANLSGHENTAAGSGALFSNTTGSYNTAIGDDALFSNDIGEHNTAAGSEALYFNLSGIDNVATGFKSLNQNTIGSGNTASGAFALNSNTVGSSNAAFGNQAGYENITGSGNSFFGYLSGEKTNANGNSFFGLSAGKTNVSGTLNTCVGYDSYPQFSNLTNATAIGANAVVTQSNAIQLGSGITKLSCQTTMITTSDARVKTNITENIPGLPFIQKLRPVSYRYDIHRQNELMGLADTTTWEGKYDIEKMTFTGFIAQEVEQAARETNFDFSGVDAPANDKSLYGLRYAEFTVPLVKAVQEQQALIETQRLQLENQGKMLSALQARLEVLEAAAKVEKR